MTRNSPKKQALIDWLRDPNRPKDAWKTMSFQEIADATQVSKGYVGNILIGTVSDTFNLDYQEVKTLREEGRAGNNTVAISDEKKKEINTLLGEGKTPDEVAFIAKVSRSTVDRRCDRRKIRNKRKRRTPSKDEIDDFQQRRKDGDTLSKIADDTGFSSSTVGRYCKGIKRGKRK